MEIQAVLRPLSQLERSISELYLSLSERFSSDAEAAAVFLRLALEEQAHVGLIEYQRRVARWSPEQFGEVDVDLEEVLETTRKVMQLRDSGEPISLAEAVRAALELEVGAAEHHAQNAVRQTDPGLSQLLGSLSSGDHDHVASLRAFAAKRCLGPERDAGGVEAHPSVASAL